MSDLPPGYSLIPAPQDAPVYEDLPKGYSVIKPEQSSSLGDAARFAGTAVVRGLGGLANFATDPMAPLRTLVSPGLERIEKQGSPNNQGPTEDAPNWMKAAATAGNIAAAPGTAAGNQVFNSTGMREYRPTTEVGRVGLSAAEGAAGGAPFGFIPALIAALSGGSGRFAGDLTGSERIGTGVALATGLGLGKPASMLQERLTPPGELATQLLSNDIRRGGNGIDVDAMRAALAQDPAIMAGLTPKPLSLADVGPANMQGRGEAIANSPGAGAEIARSFLTERDKGAGPRLLTDLGENLGPGPSAFKTAQTLQDQRALQSAPLYAKALNTDKPIISDRLQQFIDDPVLQSGLAQGIELQRLESLAKGTPFNPNDTGIVYDQTGTPRFSPTPNMRTLDAAKRGLDNMLDQYRDPTSGRLVLDQRGRAIDQVRQSYLKELDAINPDYAAAREAWSGPSQSMGAMKQGADIFNQHPEQINENIGRLSDSDKQFFLLGARDALAQKIAKTSAGGNEALRIVGNQHVQDQLRPLFSDDKSFGAFINQAQLESLMYQTMNNNLGNSRTYRRAAFAAGEGGAESGRVLGPAVEAGAIALMNPHAALPALLRMAKGLASSVKGAGVTPPAAQAEIARMLFSSDPSANAATLDALMRSQGTPTPFSLAPMVPAGLIAGERRR